MLQQALFWLVCSGKQSVHSYNVQLKSFLSPLLVRLHLCSAERHPLPGTPVCLRPLDLLPLQSVWQRHQGTGGTGGTGAAVHDGTRLVQTTCVSASHLMLFLGQIAIPVTSVAHIKKTKTAILVPNALVIATASDKVRRSDHPEATAQKPRLLG